MISRLFPKRRLHGANDPVEHGQRADLRAEARAINEACETLLRPLSDEMLLGLARSVFELRPLGPLPGWYFSWAEHKADPATRLRWAIWQTCAERKLQKPAVFPWYEGTSINLYLGNDMSRPTFVGGCIEPNEFAFLSSTLQQGMVMLDIGANDGFFTVFAARRVGEAGRVFAFEPSPRELARLRANISLNNLQNTEALPVALAETRGRAQLRISEYGHEGQNTLGDFVHDVSQGGMETVEICPLDDFLEGQNLTRLDFIKLDAEGAEQRVLAGARRTMARFKPIILLELLDGALRHQGSSSAAVIEFLLGLDYRIYDFSETTGGLIESASGPHSDNIVASPVPLADISRR